MMEPLSPREGRALAAMEKAIETHLSSFLLVGSQLQEIRDKKLYRASYATFEEYCRRRWKFSRSKAYRLIAWAEVGQNLGEDGESLSPIGDKNSPISHESQARELAFLPRDVQRQILAQAQAAKENPTAAELREIVQELATDYVREEEAARLAELQRSKKPVTTSNLLGRIEKKLTELERLCDRLDDAGKAKVAARLQDLLSLIGS